jgi:hypothetical protein
VLTMCAEQKATVMAPLKTKHDAITTNSNAACSNPTTNNTTSKLPLRDDPHKISPEARPHKIISLTAYQILSTLAYFLSKRSLIWKPYALQTLPICRIFGLLVLTTKSVIFWNVLPCGSCKNRRFEVTYRLHLQLPAAANVLLLR